MYILFAVNIKIIPDVLDVVYMYFQPFEKKRKLFATDELFEEDNDTIAVKEEKGPTVADRVSR